MQLFSKNLNPQNIEKSVSDIRIRIRFSFDSRFWISVSGCKLTILLDIQPANRIVIISAVRCQAKFLTSVKFLTSCCFSVILLLSIKK